MTVGRGGRGRRRIRNGAIMARSCMAVKSSVLMYRCHRRRLSRPRPRPRSTMWMEWKCDDDDMLATLFGYFLIVTSSTLSHRISQPLHPFHLLYDITFDSNANTSSTVRKNTPFSSSCRGTRIPVMGNMIIPTTLPRLNGVKLRLRQITRMSFVFSSHHPPSYLLSCPFHIQVQIILCESRCKSLRRLDIITVV